MTQPSNASGDWHEIVMRRANLQDLPRFEVPAGFGLRAYKTGDGEAWTAIHRRADAFNLFTPDTFREVFGHDEEALRSRQKFLLGPDGEPIGTATAWFDEPEPGAEVGVGRVHWVAIVPQFQGRGLARPLVSAVMHTLRDLGHQSAVLSTDSRRPVAVAVYRKFGFEVADG